MAQLLPVEPCIQVSALVAVFDERRPVGFYFAGESHDFWEIVYVAEGEVTATADERVYHLRPGQLLLHKPMEFHRIWAEGDCSPYFINLSFRASGSALAALEGGCFELDEDLKRRFREVTAAYHAVMASAPERRPSAVSYAAALLEVMLLELTERGTTPHRIPSGGEARYAAIVEVMKANCHRNLSLEELAALCGMSVSNMKRVFGRYSDVGLAKYFLSLKMHRAMALLDAGERADRVAEALDFSEISYFYTVFKRETGMTPSQYRKAHT